MPRRCRPQFPDAFSEVKSGADVRPYGFPRRDGRRSREWRLRPSGFADVALLLTARPPNYGQVSSGRLMTIGVAVLRTTTHRNGSCSEGLISMCGRKAGTWMKSPAFARATDSPRSPQR